MTKAMESRTLATKFQEALKASDECIIEIRAPIGNSAGQRLHKTLTLAGIQAALVDVIASPHSGILIETNQRCAKTALSVQSAFHAVGVEAHLLVQNTPREDLIVIHLNESADPTTPKKT